MIKNLILCSMLLALCLMGCAIHLPGSGASTRTVKKAVQQTIKDTKTESINTGRIKGEIQLTINGQPATGTINASFKGESKGELIPPQLGDPDSSGQPQGSMVMALLALFQWMLILTILITWLMTNRLGSFFKRMAKRSLSIIVSGLVTGGYLMFSGYNSFDLVCMGVLAWGAANYIYDLAVKKGYKELIGIKNHKKGGGE